jgi:hypothetical protein
MQDTHYVGLVPLESYKGHTTYLIKARKALATAVSYSSQHAAFNLIVCAVGHHILQLLVLVDVSQWHQMTLHI